MPLLSSVLLLETEAPVSNHHRVSGKNLEAEADAAETLRIRRTRTPTLPAPTLPTMTPISLMVHCPGSGGRGGDTAVVEGDSSHARDRDQHPRSPSPSVAVAISTVRESEARRPCPRNCHIRCAMSFKDDENPMRLVMICFDILMIRHDMI